MKFIQYSQKYEKEVIRLWNKELRFDNIDIHKFRKQALFDDNFNNELCYISLEDEKLIGFILGTKRIFPYLERGLEPDRGWINVMFVDNDYQNKGVGTKLLELIENKLISMNVKEITLGSYSPNYFLPGIDTENYIEAKNFFEKRGYIKGKTAYSMKRDLHGYQVSDNVIQKISQLEKEGITFEKFDYKYSLDLLKFLKDEFGGGWKRNALIAMREKVAEETMWLVLNKEDEIIGYCQRMIDGNPMRFGPIGIGEKARNKKIGSVLLELQLHDMSEKGIYHMYFVTTDDPGKRFYLRHGLEVFRTFTDYRKKVD